jgi:UDP-N-acetylmuramoylalanine--D-glutamate ligase
LNTYKGLADYIKAKKNIFKFQNLQDYLVISRDNPKTFSAARRAPGQRYWFSKKYFSEENGSFVRNNFIYFRRDGIEHKICSIKNIALAGEHNLENILAAVCVAEIYGVKLAAVKKVLALFKGIPNRLELLREIRGIKYYNDTTSTTPEATIAALRTLGCHPERSEGSRGKKIRSFARAQDDKNIVLIAGGSDKGLDFKQLVQEIKKHCKAVVLLNGTGTIRLKKKLTVIGKPSSVSLVDSMKEAVKAARQIAKAGDIILLSPACASFGMFNNEFDRGEQFRKIVRNLR